jgi:hypothetical protein
MLFIILFSFTCSTRFGVECVAVFRLSPNRFASLGVIYLEDLRSSFLHS